MAMLAQLRKKLADSRTALDNATGIEDAGLAQSEIVARRAQLEKSQNEVTNYLNKMMQDLSEQTGGFGPIMQATDQAALGKSVQDTIKNPTRPYKAILEINTIKYLTILTCYKKQNLIIKSERI